MLGWDQSILDAILDFPSNINMQILYTKLNLLSIIAWADTKTHHYKRFVVKNLILYVLVANLDAILDLTP